MLGRDGGLAVHSERAQWRPVLVFVLEVADVVAKDFLDFDVELTQV